VRLRCAVSLSWHANRRRDGDCVAGHDPVEIAELIDKIDKSKPFSDEHGLTNCGPPECPRRPANRNEVIAKIMASRAAANAADGGLSPSNESRSRLFSPPPELLRLRSSYVKTTPPRHLPFCLIHKFPFLVYQFIRILFCVLCMYSISFLYPHGDKLTRATSAPRCK